MNQLPAQIYPLKIKGPKLNIVYPVVNIPNLQAQQIINQTIVTLVQSMIKEQQYEQGKTEMIGYFEVKNNQRGIISINFINYTYTPRAAHGLTRIKSITANIENGQIYQLKDLFKPGSNYINTLSDIIKLQIMKRDIPLINEFKTITPNQDFYLADKIIVIYFQLYDLTSYVYGFPMFPITVYEVDTIVTEDGPFGRMIAY